MTRAAILAATAVLAAPCLVHGEVLKRSRVDYGSMERCVEHARLVSQRFVSQSDALGLREVERTLFDRRPEKFVARVSYSENGRLLLATVVCRAGGRAVTTHQTVE